MNTNDYQPQPTRPDPGIAENESWKSGPRRWPWIVGIVAALFAGTFVGAAVAVAPAADVEPAPAVTVTAEPEVVTETETVTETVEVEVGGDCRAYAEFVLDGYERRGGIVMDGISEMADILDRDGFMVTEEFVAIVDDMTLDIEILTAEIAASNGFDCLDAS